MTGTELDCLRQVMKYGTKKERITHVRRVADSNDPGVIRLAVAGLGDTHIEVRGEAFSSLLLNKNKITEQLIEGLASENKYTRAFSALVLANRRDPGGVQEIVKLTKDDSSTVRSCALGALGFLRVDAAKAILECLSDPVLDVRQSALKAAIDTRCSLREQDINSIAGEKDAEMQNMLTVALQ